MIPFRGELWFYFNTCCVLIPNFDGAVMGGRRHLSGATRRRREEHAGGRGLKVASVLYHFAAGLTQIPELTETDGQTQDRHTLRGRSRACRRNTRVLRSSLESSTEPKGSKNLKEMNQLSLEGSAGCHTPREKISCLR